MVKRVREWEPPDHVHKSECAPEDALASMGVSFISELTPKDADGNSVTFVIHANLRPLSAAARFNLEMVHARSGNIGNHITRPRRLLKPLLNVCGRSGESHAEATREHIACG